MWHDEAMKFMDPKETLKLLEGAVDVITPAVEARRKHFEKARCPACGGRVHSEVWVEDLSRMRADEVVPYGRARCAACGCLFDPDTGLVYQKGDITQMVEPSDSLIEPGKP